MPWRGIRVRYSIEQIVKQLAKLVSIRSAEISETRSIVDEAAEVVEGARFQILA